MGMTGLVVAGTSRRRVVGRRSPHWKTAGFEEVCLFLEMKSLRLRVKMRFECWRGHSLHGQIPRDAMSVLVAQCILLASMRRTHCIVLA